MFAGVLHSDCDSHGLTTMLSMSVIVMVVGDTLPKTSNSQPIISGYSLQL
jgi:xanthine/uracil/vitamin C permease (AzgA family)